MTRPSMPQSCSLKHQQGENDVRGAHFYYFSGSTNAPLAARLATCNDVRLGGSPGVNGYMTVARTCATGQSVRMDSLGK